MFRPFRLRGAAAIGVGVVACLTFAALAAAQQRLWTPQDVAKVRSVSSAKISPDGRLIAYTLSVPRIPGKDDNGPAWAELHVVDLAGHSRPFVTGEVRVRSIHWTPDGSGISFLAKRGDDKHTALYVIPADGGEARRVVEHETGIGAYSWSPDGRRVAFLGKDKEPKAKKKQKDKGFNQEIYEEELRPTRVWIAERDGDDEPRALALEGSASELHWSPDGAHLAVALAPTPLIDDHYMRRTVHIVDADTGSPIAQIDNPGKLGKVAWSPDGQHLGIIAAADLHDPAAGRLTVVGVGGGTLTDLIPNYKGHVSDLAWQDNDTIMYIGHEGCATKLARINIDASNATTIIRSGGPILRSFSLASDGQSSCLVADSPAHPTEVFYMKHKDANPRRLTDSNAWMANMQFAKQEVVTYYARDGLDVQGILVHPLDEQEGQRYPLILTVHGGPESHYSNGWVTRYSGPGQVAAAQGYAVFHPNYRGSTGRGVAYSKLDQGDQAGPEFDDLVDGVTHLVKIGLVDERKVGITGGSYGGFASAWGATKLTKHFAASVMFVGISDQISKAGTTDIAREMNLVHARKWPWNEWDWFRERSPLYYAKQSRTPILILHGKEDPRVHPSQSMELYRYLKVIGKTPVRLVFYPGEGHGNRKAAARLDYNLRMMRWMNHYLKGPGGDPPAYEIDYGLDESDDEDSDS